MATMHVIFDPTDKILPPRPEMRLACKGLCFAALTVPDMVEDPAEIEELARKLASLLLEQMKVTAA